MTCPNFPKNVAVPIPKAGASRQVPGMLSTRTVDLWSAILQLIVLAFLSELATSAHETLMLGSGWNLSCETWMLET